MMVCIKSHRARVLFAPEADNRMSALTSGERKINWRMIESKPILGFRTVYSLETTHPSSSGGMTAMLPWLAAIFEITMSPARTG